VLKEVACATPNGCADAAGYAKSATGVKGATCPAFCYRITVTNPATNPDGTPNTTPLTNITLSDPSLNLTACNAALVGVTLQPGQSAAPCITGPVEHCSDFVNTVTARGASSFDTSQTVTATDTATVHVVPASVECVLLVHSDFDQDANNGGADGSSDDNHALIPDSGPVDLILTVKNTGQVDLNVAIVGLPCTTDISGNPIPTSITVAAGESSTPIVCSADVTCPAGASFSVTVTGTAVASSTVPCIYNVQGQAIQTAPSSCQASVACQLPVTCRVTGGGTLIEGTVDQSCIAVPTTIFDSANPSPVVKITHGGQLGAPFSQMDCGTILGNPCIRGQWQHTRHYVGNGNPRDVIDMDFHSQTPKGQYDSLSCACLGCCDPASGAFIPPTVGPKIHKFALCNPDDHKVCGPQPRPAPANAIIFSGIGRITPTDDIQGGRAAQAEWIIFRVYIEDRSEPGGFHPKGAVEPADIYCFQGWKTGIKTSKKPDFSQIAADFRTALGQANCDFLTALESGALAIGSLPSPTVNGTTADIQDCGPLHDGNQQIHPSTGATCTQ